MTYKIERTISQKTIEEVELKPCPFCGGESEMNIQKHCGSGAEYEYTPRCKVTSCAGRLTKKWLDVSVAVIAWNNRSKLKTGLVLINREGSTTS